MALSLKTEALVLSSHKVQLPPPHKNSTNPQTKTLYSQLYKRSEVSPLEKHMQTMKGEERAAKLNQVYYEEVYKVNKKSSIPKYDRTLKIL